MEIAVVSPLQGAPDIYPDRAAARFTGLLDVAGHLLLSVLSVGERLRLTFVPADKAAEPDHQQRRALLLATWPKMR
jgi:hypothetical protein